MKYSCNYEKDYQILKEIAKLQKSKPRLDFKLNLFESYDNEIAILKSKFQLI